MEINLPRRLLSELSLPPPLPLFIEYISCTAPAYLSFLILGVDVIVVSQLSIRIPLSKDGLRRADHPGSPNMDVDILRFLPEPSTPAPRLDIRKERRRSTRGHLCRNGGSLALAGAGRHATSVEPPVLVLNVVDLGQSAGARPNAQYRDN